MDGKDLVVKGKLMMQVPEVRCLIKKILSQESKGCFINFFSCQILYYSDEVNESSSRKDTHLNFCFIFSEVQTHRSCSTDLR